MSLLWAVRFGLVGVLFVLVGFSRRLLIDRARHRNLLENRPLAILAVVIFNACCYLSVGIPADPRTQAAAGILEEPIVVGGLQVLGNALIWFGACWLFVTVMRRGVVGGQDTKEGLITSGVYRFSRHPIYLGIILVSLSLPFLGANFDGLVAFPFVFLANVWQAAVEEKYDVGHRFREEYEVYRKKTWMLAPPWFWLMLAGVVAFIFAAGWLM